VSDTVLLKFPNLPISFHVDFYYIYIMGKFENEYYLLYYKSLDDYPLINEDCKRIICKYKKRRNCDNVKDCPAYTRNIKKIENPKPFILDLTYMDSYFNKKKVVYADCYMDISLSPCSFVVSPKLYEVLHGIDLEGIQFIPVILMEDDEMKYNDFWYVNLYNVLDVLSVKNCKFQVFYGMLSDKNLLEIKFDSKKMKEISLEKRLIFRLSLGRSYFIFHESIVEKIMSINPVGFEFIKISDYHVTNTNQIFV